MKHAYVSCAALVLVLLSGYQSARAEGWSPTNWFTTTKSESKPKQPAAKPAKKPPSTLGKMGSDTKKFFTGIGDTLTGKKSATKKPATQQSASPLTSQQTRPVTVAKGSQGKQSSWNPFRREEPKGPQSLRDFVGMERPQ